MKDLIIMGAGGFGRETAWIVERINLIQPTWNLLGFLDDDIHFITGRTINGIPVLGNSKAIENYPYAFYVCAIGDPTVRTATVKRMVNMLPSIKFATLIDPSVDISRFVIIKEGCIISARNVITVNIKIGSHVIITSGCNIGHDAVLHDFVTIFPGVNLSGMTRIGYGASIGTGSQIIQGRTIGQNTIIGAGSTVIRDIPSDCVAVGCPCIPIKNRVNVSTR